MDADADPRSILTRSARAPDLVLAYGADQDQLGEVWWPAGLDEGSGVLVMVIHGGFWQAEWDRVHARPMAAAIADAGHTVCSVEYRRIGSPGGGGWPGTFDDIGTAVDRLPEMINDASPTGRRTSRVVLVGHSAGGHLALWAAARHRLPANQPWHSANPLALHGIVALAPVGALARADHDGVGEGAVAELVGGSVDTCPDRYAVVDPAQLLPSGVPTVVVHGDQDEQVPIAQSRAYVVDAAAAGEEIVLVPVEAEHFAIIDPASRVWPTVLAALDRVARPRPTA